MYSTNRHKPNIWQSDRREGTINSTRLSSSTSFRRSCRAGGMEVIAMNDEGVELIVNPTLTIFNPEQVKSPDKFLWCTLCLDRSHRASQFPLITLHFPQSSPRVGQKAWGLYQIVRLDLTGRYMDIHVHHQRPLSYKHRRLGCQEQFTIKASNEDRQWIANPCTCRKLEPKGARLKRSVDLTPRSRDVWSRFREGKNN